RYFPEPDLPPLMLSDQYIEAVHRLMPELPETLFNRFTGELGLSEYDAGVLTDDKATAAYFLEVVKHTANYKAAANWVTVHIRGYLNEHAISIDDFPLSGKRIADLIALIDSGQISNSIAAQKLFPAMIGQEGKSPLELAESLNLLQTGDTDLIEGIADEVLASLPQKVAEYQQGKTGLLGLFVGEIMKRSKGKADPRKVNEVLLKKLGA
ncbi:MAG: Asp-tRNA(Asn)/Glu-tRNA(Gln) amidotransferase GatCAB subunit B, partial [Bacteroidetes bacterium]|nr:Asp-tRNA(Asn)/Glu-tRNA(Gln) amidotransferase GatCAB subunit B [Bacteroidota bacterium]